MNKEAGEKESNNNITKRSKGFGMDLLNGRIWSSIIAFALPLALTSMLQQLFNAADVAILGQFVGKEAMAAVGSDSPVVGLFVNFFVGLSIGANVVISNLTGKGNERRVSQAVHTSLVLAVMCGFAVMIAGLIMSVPIVRWMGAPEAILPQAELYLRIYLCGMPVILLYNFEAAIFRSQGDTRTPLICLTISGCINVGLNLFFVLVCGMKVDGVALATVIANAVSAAMLFVLLLRHEGLIRIEIDKLKMDKAILRHVLRIGIPSGLQSMVFSVSNIIIQSAVNSLGAAVMAGSAAAFNIEIISFFMLNSFTQTFVTFIGQNYGAGQYNRCHKIIRQGLMLDLAFTVALGMFLLLFSRSLLGIFNSDQEVIDAGITRLKFILTAQSINCIMDGLSGVMRGFGYSMVPAVIMFVGTCGVRVFWVYAIFPIKRTFSLLMVCYPLSWIISSIAVIIAYFVIIRRVLPDKNGKLMSNAGNNIA